MFIYVASPYTGSHSLENERYESVCKACLLLAQLGHTPYSPIAHWHPIERMAPKKLDYERYIAMDLTMLTKAEAVYVYTLDGHAESTGIRREIDFAKNLGLPIRYFTIEGGEFTYVS